MSPRNTPTKLVINQPDSGYANAGANIAAYATPENVNATLSIFQQLFNKGNTSNTQQTSPQVVYVPQQNQNTPPAKTGLSGWAIAGISLLGVAAVGTTFYFILRPKKTGK